MKTHLGDPSQRAYVSVLVAMLREDHDERHDVRDSRQAVASYLRTHRDDELDADLVIVGDSYSDPLPIHCFIMARSGQRLADANRCCQIRGRVYESVNRLGFTVSGVVLARISVRHLLGDYVLLAALEARTRRRVYDTRTAHILPFVKSEVDKRIDDDRKAT